MYCDTGMSELAVIFGLEGPRLTAGEKAFFRDANPWAFILFGRNIETPDQVKRLTDEIKACTAHDPLIFVDQEGGRVQRFRPPHWPDYPSGADLSVGYEAHRPSRRRAVYLHHRLIADDLRAIGLNANCAPVLDIPLPEANAIISDRAFGTIADQVIDLTHAAMSGMMNGGIAPVIKHIPGHGRAMVDSHLALPRVGESLEFLGQSDFRPFQALRDAPMAMTAHIVYEAVDSNLPLTLSSEAIETVVRDGIGFDGLLMSDDLDMKALSGTLLQKTRGALAAGCDIALHCSGNMPDMVKVAKGAHRLSGKAKYRADMARLCAVDIDPFDRKAAWDELVSLVPSMKAAA